MNKSEQLDSLFQEIADCHAIGSDARVATRLESQPTDLVISFTDEGTSPFTVTIKLVDVVCKQEDGVDYSTTLAEVTDDFCTVLVTPRPSTILAVIFR